MSVGDGSGRGRHTQPGCGQLQAQCRLAYLLPQPTGNETDGKHAHNGQQKLNLRSKKEGAQRIGTLEVLLETVSLEMTTKSVGAGTHSKSWRERLPDYRSGNAEAAGAK